jgi:hypothetical protein
MAIALGLGHAMALTPCAPVGEGLLRQAIFWIDAELSDTLTAPSGDPGSEPLIEEA